MKHRPKPKAVRQALAIMKAVTAPTERERAERRIRAAVAEYRAVERERLEGVPGVEARLAAALEELNTARADVARLEGKK